MRDEARLARWVLLIDTHEAIAEHEHFGRWVVREERSGVPTYDLSRGDCLWRHSCLDLWRPDHPYEISDLLDGSGPRHIVDGARCQPASLDDSSGYSRRGHLHSD